MKHKKMKIYKICYDINDLTIILKYTKEHVIELIEKEKVTYYKSIQHEFFMTEFEVKKLLKKILKNIVDNMEQNIKKNLIAGLERHAVTIEQEIERIIDLTLLIYSNDLK